MYCKISLQVSIYKDSTLFRRVHEHNRMAFDMDFFIPSSENIQENNKYDLSWRRVHLTNQEGSFGYYIA